MRKNKGAKHINIDYKYFTCRHPHISWIATSKKIKSVTKLLKNPLNKN